MEESSSSSQPSNDDSLIIPSENEHQAELCERLIPVLRMMRSSHQKIAEESSNGIHDSDEEIPEENNLETPLFKQEQQSQEGRTSSQLLRLSNIVRDAESSTRLKKKIIYLQLCKLGLDERLIVIVLEGLSREVLDGSVEEIMQIAANTIIDSPLLNEEIDENNFPPLLQSIQKFYKATLLFQPLKSSFRVSRGYSQSSLISVEDGFEEREIVAAIASAAAATAAVERMSESNKKAVKECLICTCEIEEVKKSMSRLACHASHTFCEDCLKAYLLDKINKSDVLLIRCPQEACMNQFNDDDVAAILADDMQNERYLRFKQRQQLANDPDIRWCLIPGCSTATKALAGQRRVVCSSCSGAQCYFCQSAWHEGNDCEKAMDKEYKLMARMFQVKNCPRCASRMQKGEGCNHMTCTRCSYQFCWLCLGKYSYKHYSSYNIFGCPGMQYAERRPAFFKLRILTKLALKGIGIFLLFLLALGLLPLALTILLIIVPSFIHKEIVSYDYHLTKKVWHFLVTTVVGCATIPLNLPVMLLYILHDM